MADGTIGIDEPLAADIDKKLDTEIITVAGVSVHRERIIVANLLPSSWDYADLLYTGALLTSVVFKQGGAGGTTVATLTLGYAGDTLISVTRT